MSSSDRPTCNRTLTGNVACQTVSTGPVLNRRSSCPRKYWTDPVFTGPCVLYLTVLVWQLEGCPACKKYSSNYLQMSTVSIEAPSPGNFHLYRTITNDISLLLARLYQPVLKRCIRADICQSYDLAPHRLSNEPKICCLEWPWMAVLCYILFCSEAWLSELGYS